MSNHENLNINVREILDSDIQTVTDILLSTNLCEEKALEKRLKCAIGACNSICLIAFNDNTPAGALLASYNGFHVFLSHIAVLDIYQRKGIGMALHSALIKKANELDAQGIISDSWLTSTPFFHKLGYKTPGAVFMIKEISPK